MLNDISLLDKGFWESAFDKGAPFYDSYLKYFRKGVTENIPSLLDIHREAIYYLNDAALVPIIPKLIRIAAQFPDSSFVESLAFFLNQNEQKNKLIKANKSHWQNNKQIKNDINSLCTSLRETGDEEMAKQFKVFGQMMRIH